MKTFTQLILLSVILCCCEYSDKNIETKALVILSGDFQGRLFKEQKAIIAFKDSRDSVYVKRVDLPQFENPAYPGDSIEILVSPKRIKFGKLYKYPYNIKNRYLYALDHGEVTRKALFDNGVLSFGNFNTEGEMLYMEFYTYQIKAEDGVLVSPIGFPDEVAFLMHGNLGEDSLFVSWHNEAYLFRYIK
ncbi:MAG: hypothetical protein JJU02_00810 [Cryomorphaceae bacterium]|nr:hypothetical protein [Cryomorphaceae bacterium]